MRPTRRNLLGALLGPALLLAACGGGPTSAAHPGAITPAAVPSTAPSGGAAAAPSAAPAQELFAALEPGGSTPSPVDTAVAIVGLDGYARAKATFAPRQVPVIADAATILQPEARVVTGGVLFADGSGQVRRLTTSGTQSAVATFPIGAQQELSFAASADGSHLLAVRFTFPPLKNPPPSDMSQGIYAPGDYGEDVLAADAGQGAASLGHLSWPQSTFPTHVLAMVGWSSKGPLATTDTRLGTQNPTPGQRIFGQLVHLDASGNPGPVVGGPDCVAWDFLKDDTVLCGSADYRAVSVRNGAGQALFTLPNPGGHQYADLTLAPDASHFTAQDLAQDHAMLVDRAGHTTSLPSGFVAQGWLDPQTVVGAVQGGTLQLVHVDQPAKLADLGFKGLFVGPVSPS